MTEHERGSAAAGRALKPPTIYDVARAAGVATSTVSRAFSRPGRISAATAAHVLRVAAELGYRANPLAYGLRTGRSSVLALVVSDVTNPFYTEIIRGAEHAASEAGYVLLLIDAQTSEHRERRRLEAALPGVDGVVLAGTRLPDSTIGVMARQCPTVVLDRDVADVPSIVPDNAHGMRAAVEHLMDLGHDSLTYIAGPEVSWADGTRWHSLREAAADLGCKARRTSPCAPTIAGGHEAAAALPRRLPTAVVAYNDQLAIGLMLALQRRGIRIPQDVSVVGFDNVASSRIVTPGLTTVAAPLRALGRAAVTTVLSQRDTPDPGRPRKRMTLPVKLVVRDSTRPPRPRRHCPPDAAATNKPRRDRAERRRRAPQSSGETWAVTT